MEDKIICVPGQRLCLSDDEHVSGSGTYERQGYIYATVAGVVDLVKQDKGFLVQVHNKEQSIVPMPGDVVTCKVNVINQRLCRCSITCIGDTVLMRPFRAILRKEDVRATEKDSIEMQKCFRSGDIILAKVLPMKEIHSYQITTAENELGVVIAHSESGGVSMVPISWTEMQCPKTYNREFRKVAKVGPENIVID
ncbi:unnamed protein product [Bemisia tabaci]|uniref:Exosome complex component CSL4 n=1 Tax=Bemisia tabaci TaxID=7038 RepID=A0A9P0AE81_BEMTA|nr:PREDICTED: exosome complex component CSL4 [Bemisia tabaci]CAH0391261.1 unnamed protein product [Bemisia tabaci]